MSLLAHRHLRPVRRVLAVSLLVAAAGLLGATAAQAHVHVVADDTTAGAFSVLTFRVPTESDSASTTKISITLPDDTPFVFVSAKPIAGWTVESVTKKLPEPVDYQGTTITKAVRTVTWTASRSAAVAPGEFQEFSLSVGPLPAAGTVLLPAVQTYSDGSVVRWDQPTPASGEEPEHPAPQLTVTAAAADTATATGTDWWARGLGAAGVLLGAVGLVLALVHRRSGAGG